MQKMLLYPITAVIVFIIVLSLMLFVVNPMLASSTATANISPQKLMFSLNDFSEKAVILQSTMDKLPYKESLKFEKFNVLQLLEKTEINEKTSFWEKFGFRKITIEGINDKTTILTKENKVIALFPASEYLETIMISFNNAEPIESTENIHTIKEIVNTAFNKTK